MKTILLVLLSFGFVFPAHATPEIDTLCQEIDLEVTAFKWKLPKCQALVEWKSLGQSVKGRPLIYAEFGNPNSKNTTLVFSMVHGDEVTPLFLGLKLVDWLKQQPVMLQTHRIIVAPLVNPDSFFSTPRTRVNARGVDVNRNLGTLDWKSKALQTWKTQFKSDKRRFPGNEPDSEPETVFQKELIKQTNPSKILSIHSPLNHLDYDGPTTLSLWRFPKDYVDECIKLSKKVKAKSTGYFIGSLGNYAGTERGIPTFTMELPTANPKKAWDYWTIFKAGIKTVIQHEVPRVITH